MNAYIYMYVYMHVCILAHMYIEVDREIDR